MKIGDLIEVYRHIPKYESGAIPVGRMGVGVIVDIEKRDRQFSKKNPDTVVSYVTPDGNIESEWVGGEDSGIVVTMRVLNGDY